MTEKIKTIDLSVPRRRYYSDECNLTICPECDADLIEESSAILLHVKSNTDERDFMTSLSGSHFCKKCPVVVFDTDKLDQAATIGIKTSENVKYFVVGMVDLDSVPEEKKRLELGSDENPMPLVRFLPDLNNQTAIKNKKPGRNEPCLCGSGKKYKKCCGK